MDFLWTLEGIRSPLLDTAFLWITRLGEEMMVKISNFCNLPIFNFSFCWKMKPKRKVKLILANQWL